MVPLVIYSSRKNTAGLMFTSIALTSASFLLGSNEWVISLNASGASLLLYAGTVFFGSTSLITIFRFVVQKPAFIFSEKGIENLSIVFGASLIPWEEVDNIFYQSTANGDFLVVALRKPVDFSRNAGFLKRLIFKSRLITSPEKIAISQALLPVSVGEFVKKVMEFYPAVRVHYPYPILDVDRSG